MNDLVLYIGGERGRGGSNSRPAKILISALGEGAFIRLFTGAFISLLKGGHSYYVFIKGAIHIVGYIRGLS